MKDEEYLFHSDCREKKTTARSARNKRTHNGKSGRVRLPSDYMTKKELNAMNGEVKSYRLNEPMSWKEFKAMPDDIKKTYIQLLREKYNVADLHISKMMGTNPCSFSQEMTRLGLNVGKRTRDSKWDADGFFAWANGTKIATEEETKEAEEPVAEEKPQYIVLKPEDRPEMKLKPIRADYVESPRLIAPNHGNMVFEGNVVEVMKSVCMLLGNAYVHMSVTFDVLPEPVKGCEDGT